MRLFIKYLYIFFFLSASLYVPARAEISLFRSDELLRIELRSDFTSLIADRTGEALYRDALFIVMNSENSSDTFNVRLMVRGNFRLRPENCNFPPLLVNFRKNEMKGTVFNDLNEVKLVTPCRTDEDVVEEYLVYKMYNKVTDISLGARLALIRYVDSRTDSLLFERYSFFIEPVDNLEDRLDGKERDIMTTPFQLERDNFMKLALFQYMIGNKDWFITTRQNIILIQPELKDSPLLAVPYDFDFSGFVNAEYTKPRGIADDHLADRRAYKGLCYSEQEFRDAFSFYRDLKPSFLEIIKSAEYLSREDKQQLIIYINEFLHLINYRKAAIKLFSSNCETRKMYNLPE